MIGNARLRETVGNFRSGFPVFLVAFNRSGARKKVRKEVKQRKKNRRAKRVERWTGEGIFNLAFSRLNFPPLGSLEPVSRKSR